MNACLYSCPSHRACTLHLFCSAFYFHLWPVCATIFFHIIEKGMIFGKKVVTENKTCTLILSTNSVWKILRRILRGIIINVHRSSHVIRNNLMLTFYVNDLINYSVFDMFRTSKCSSSGRLVYAALWYFCQSEIIIKAMWNV